MTSPVGNVLSSLVLITTMLALASVLGTLVLILVVGAGRLRRDNAFMLLISSFLIVGTLSWLAWQPVVISLFLYVPNGWRHTVSVVAALLCSMAFVGAYFVLTTYETRFDLYIKHKVGFVGELKVRKALEKAGFEAVHGVYVPSGNGARQLDHIVRVGKCIIVLETKNWQGQLFGRADEPTWTKKLSGKSSNIDNPIKQLDGQVRALSKAIGAPVHGFVVFCDRCEFPGDTPDGAMHLCELPRKLEMLKLAASIGTDGTPKGWDEVLCIAGNDRLQAELKVRHDAWVVARPRTLIREPMPYVMRCSGCGNTQNLTLNEPSRPGYSWYWRCGCQENTPAILESGWQFVRQGKNYVCKAEDGRVVAVHV